jgi:hypothetical protein
MRESVTTGARISNEKAMTEEKKTFLQRTSLLMTIFVLIAALYAAWIFYSRWSDAVQARKAEQIREIERERQEVALNGGTQLKIMMLYATAGTVSRGQSVQICYGVANARNVSFDPPISNVWPSMNRCVNVSPGKSTTYTLSADDGLGHSEQAKVSVQVR